MLSDNGRWFVGRRTEWFLEKLNIEHHSASARHAPTNGQVEAANKVILNGPNMDWRARKMFCGSLELFLKINSWETIQPSLWVAAVTPIEITMATDRVWYFNAICNNYKRQLKLDLENKILWPSKERKGKCALPWQDTTSTEFSLFIFLWGKLYDKWMSLDTKLRLTKCPLNGRAFIKSSLYHT